MTQTPRLIKKYPNRRLYDTETSTYITLSEVKLLVLANTDFQVVDAKSGQDLTRSILMQIILEEESGAAPLFTSDMLSQMIRSYGNAMQGLMGNYLEKGMQSFLEIQEKLQHQARSLYGEAPGMSVDVWGQFLKAQSPALQGLMGNYLEQSAQLFVEMQGEMSKSARSMFSGFPFTPPAPGAGTDSQAADEDVDADTADEPPPAAKAGRGRTR